MEVCTRLAFDLTIRAIYLKKVLTKINVNIYINGFISDKKEKIARYLPCKNNGCPATFASSGYFTGGLYIKCIE